MSSAHAADAESRGAVAALVVATAPGADAQTRARLWRSVAGRALVCWPLSMLAQLDDLGFCALIVPAERYDDGIQVMQSAMPTAGHAVIPTAEYTWRSALASMRDSPAPCEWIIVMDAAWPLVTVASLRAGLRAATRTGVAIACEPVKETLKRVDGRLVVETPPRDNLRRLFSPAVFSRAAAQRMLERYDSPSAPTPDLVMLAQWAGAPLTAFDAGYPSVRVTSEDDLAILETLLAQRQPEAS